jgi:hypothetical protein
MDNKILTINPADVSQLKTENIRYDKLFIIKAVISCSIIIFSFLNTWFGFVMPSGDIECYKDLTFLLIFASFCVDVTVVSMLAFWVFYGKSWRILISCFIFYGFRALLQVN